MTAFTARPTVAALAVAAMALRPSSAGAAHGKTHRFWSHQTSFVMRNADGTVLTDQREPAAGMSFTSTDDDYAGNHAKHGKQVVATDHISCTFTEVDIAQQKLIAVCDGQIALAGGMVLSDRVTVNLAASPTIFKLTGGTGSYARVKSGTATAITYSTKTGDTDLVIAL
jgi:hypothetical protein